MTFISRLDTMILDMNGEIDKVRKARSDKNHHVNYVSNEINIILQEEAKKYPDEPTRPLGYCLSKVGDIILESFERLDKIESNILVTISAYNHARDEFVAYENEIKQASSFAEKDDEKDDDKSKKPKRKKIRKIGERPVNKIKSRIKSSKVKELSNLENNNKKTKRKKNKT